MKIRIETAHCNEWHQWFAWRPVRTECGAWVWGEMVWRRYAAPQCMGDPGGMIYATAKPEPEPTE